MENNESTSTRSDDTLSVSEGLRPGGQLPVVVPPKTNLGRRIMIWLAVGGVCLLVGALVVYLGLYIPGQDALKSTHDELAAVQQNLTDTQAALETANADLLAARTNAEDSVAELAELQTRVPLLQVQNDILAARLALANEDRTTANLMLSQADVDMAVLVDVLKVTNPDAAGSLQQRLAVVLAAFARNDKTETALELRTLTENLNMLGQR